MADTINSKLANKYFPHYADCALWAATGEDDEPLDGLYSIDDISDEDGWVVVKNNLLNNVGTNSIPVIYVDEVEQEGALIMRHEHDGRDLELEHAEKVVEHAKVLWDGHVKLFTDLEDELWEI